MPKKKSPAQDKPLKEFIQDETSFEKALEELAERAANLPAGATGEIDDPDLAEYLEKQMKPLKLTPKEQLAELDDATKAAMQLWQKALSQLVKGNDEFAYSDTMQLVLDIFPDAGEWYEANRQDPFYTFIVLDIILHDRQTIKEHVDAGDYEPSIFDFTGENGNGREILTSFYMQETIDDTDLLSGNNERPIESDTAARSHVAGKKAAPPVRGKKSKDMPPYDRDENGLHVRAFPADEQPQKQPPITDYLTMPTSPTMNVIYEIFSSGGDPSKLPGIKANVSHGTKYEVTADSSGNRYRITEKTKAEENTVEISNLDKITRSKNAKKIFVLSLIKANQQALYNGQLTRDYITFPLKELVDRGIYKSVRSARAGFNLCMDALTDMKAKGRRTKGKKIESDKLRVLFDGGDIIESQCYVYLNPRFNWQSVAEYFSVIPPYYFKLSSRASDLLQFIFYIARQRTREIARQGYFTISFRTIQNRLNLPDEKETRNPGRDIKEAIENALEEIEIENSNYYHNDEFAMLPVYDDDAPIADFLNDGYLRIELKGETAQRFIDLDKRRARKIEAADKKKQKAIEQKKQTT